MFTGIIENLGKVKSKTTNSFVFSANKNFCKKIKKGTSVAVNGVCLTVVKKINNSFLMEVMPETQNKTTLGRLQINESVNLEFPTTTNTFLSGHIVQGHVDGVGVVKKIKTQGNSHVLKIEACKEIMKFVVNKGSVALNGVSLTVVEAKNNSFTVSIIPFTWNNTTLGFLKAGDNINIETDILGKYLLKFLNK